MDNLVRRRGGIKPTTASSCSSSSSSSSSRSGRRSGRRPPVGPSRFRTKSSSSSSYAPSGSGSGSGGGNSSTLPPPSSDEDNPLREIVAARKSHDWERMLREADASIAAASGANNLSPLLFALRAEALLELPKIGNAESCLSKMVLSPQTTDASHHTKISGMVADAYVLTVRARIQMALGRFAEALSAVDRAFQMEPKNLDIAILRIKVVATRKDIRVGNQLFEQRKYSEASIAYKNALDNDPSNSIVYSNRAACWFELGEWKKCLHDCKQALYFNPNDSEALRRRAFANTRLQLWDGAVRDYLVLKREFPNNGEYAASLLHAQAELRRSRREKAPGKAENITKSGELNQFRGAILDQDQGARLSVVYFKSTQCLEISSYLDTSKYPSIKFIQVNIEDCKYIAEVEGVEKVPSFRFYKKNETTKDLVRPTPAELESSVRQYLPSSAPGPQFSGN